MAPSLEDIQQALDVLSGVDLSAFAGNEIARAKAHGQALALSQRLETPLYTLNREIWIQPAISAAIKVGQDLRLFDHLPRDGPGLTLEELAQRTGASAEFLIRILRLLSSTQFIEQCKENTFRGTATSEAFAKPGWIGGMTHLFAHVWFCFAGLPSFMQATGYQDPQDASKGPWQYALKSDGPFFDWLKDHPVEAEGFHELMACHHDPTAMSWTQVYPVERLAADPPRNPSTPLVVDIGGGIGRDMRNLRDRLKPQKFRFQVHEMESVVQQGRNDSANDDSIEFVAHDFFLNQPTRGAKAYFMHSIIHDWPDHQAIKILKNIRASMEPGYSRLLLNERVVPREEVPTAIASMDIMMMGLLCSKERAEDDWTRLLSDAGFRLEKIWVSPDKSRTQVIEAVPIEDSSV